MKSCKMIEVEKLPKTVGGTFLNILPREIEFGIFSVFLYVLGDVGFFCESSTPNLMEVKS